MIHDQLSITGIGSVSPFGPLRGLISRREIEPRPISAWPTEGLRRAFLVEPFRPSDIISTLKTRRLDRLSVWCLVAAGLAMQDAKLDLNKEDRTRVAVVLGTGLGCVELTESFFQSIATNGYAKSDPIIFPEGLTNAPASHVARVFGLRGPNLTLSHKGVSGESALMQAASLLRTDQADVVIVLAGDTLTRSIYEWFETAGVLSPACFGPAPLPIPFDHAQDGFIPGEGAAAVVLEPSHRAAQRGAQVYASYRSGFATSNPQAAVSVIRKALGAFSPADLKMVIASANGSSPHDDVEQSIIREIFGNDAPVVAPKAVVGESDSCGILRLITALSWAEANDRRLALLLGTSTTGTTAALSFDLAGESPGA
jgi:3-oxoacyl-[acyl-carrier-protein] synthase II